MGEYAWTREPKLGILPARKPVEGLALSGVVLITEHGVGYAYIKFEQSAVERIGKKMPYGIGPQTPAHLKILKKHGHYDILCSYLNKSSTIALWRSTTLPTFVRSIRYADKGEKSTSTGASSRTAGG